jgi:DNA-binding response OmpR family regulator
VTAPAGPIRVLVVDDDPSITTLYDEVLRAEGYELVVDLGLPDGDGSDFVRDAVAKYGTRPTMYVSGWTDEMWQLSEAPGRWIVMRKPLPVKRLLAAVKWLHEGGPKPAELDEG